jgi:hypothetical protein
MNPLIGLGDILIYRDSFNCDYRIEGRNLSDDIYRNYRHAR